MIRNLLAGIAGFLLAAASLVTAVEVHDHDQTDSTSVIWICASEGNKTCGPNTPHVLIAPDNFFRNW